MLMMAGQASGNMPEEARNPNISNSTSSAYPPLGTCPVVSAHQKKYAHAWGQAPGDLQTMECLKNDIQLGGVTAKNAGGGEQHMADRREARLLGLGRPYTGAVHLLGDLDPDLQALIKKWPCAAPPPTLPPSDRGSYPVVVDHLDPLPALQTPGLSCMAGKPGVQGRQANKPLVRCNATVNALFGGCQTLEMSRGRNSGSPSFFSGAC